ncbi:MAG: phosphate ABC transporter permease subunit PstC [Brevinemataceae bacterium]
MINNSLKDKSKFGFTFLFTVFFVVFVLSLLGSLILSSKDSIIKFGLNFLTDPDWNYKPLEFSSISISNESLVIHFTQPLSNKDNNLKSHISLCLQDKQIPFSSLLNNNAILITPENNLLVDVPYQIVISEKLKDQKNKSMHQPITWSGFINSNGQLITKNLSRNIHSPHENERNYGILSFIIGTLASSIIALLLTFPISLAAALFLTEYTSYDSQVAKVFSILIDLIAGIPSIIYGLWGLFFLVPRIGANLLSASIILSIMITPYAISLIRESIFLVPKKLIHAGLSLGASKFQIISKIILPYARSGIVAGVLLSLGRALGETLAVTMVIGNRNQIPTSLLSPAQTISSLIANEFGEASGLKKSALIEAGLILIIITLLFSLIGNLFIINRNKHRG